MGRQGHFDVISSGFRRQCGMAGIRQQISNFKFGSHAGYHELAILGPVEDMQKDLTRLLRYAAPGNRSHPVEE